MATDPTRIFRVAGEPESDGFLVRDVESQEGREEGVVRTSQM
jgi:hypothetical protein